MTVARTTLTFPVRSIEVRLANGGLCTESSEHLCTNDSLITISPLDTKIHNLIVLGWFRSQKCLNPCMHLYIYTCRETKREIKFWFYRGFSNLLKNHCVILHRKSDACDLCVILCNITQWFQYDSTRFFPVYIHTLSCNVNTTTCMCILYRKVSIQNT